MSLRGPARALYTWLFRLLSIVALVVIIAANILIWQTTYLGYEIDPVTSTIVFVSPDSPAEHAGVHAGDVIVRLYGMSWDEVIHHWNLLSLDAPWRSMVDLQVTREEQALAFTLYPQPSDVMYQLTNAKFLLLGLLCWTTGYLVGVARRHEVAGSFTLPTFWFALSVVLGTYTFTISASWPLHVCVLWLSVTFLAPLCVYIHLWYPPRPTGRTELRVGRAVLLATVGVANGALLVLAATMHFSLAALYATLGETVTPIAFSVAFALSAVLLFNTYRRVTIAHSRRQIRIIAAACVVVAVCWLLSLILSDGLHLDVSVADGWLGLLATLIPASYLYSGAVPNLRRMDRIAVRLCTAVVASVVIASVSLILGELLSLHLGGLLLCVALGLLFFYRTVYGLLVKLYIERDRSARVYSAFQKATERLATTLDVDALIDTLWSAVRVAFHDPAFAFYLGSLTDVNRLQLVRGRNLPSLPITIEHGELATHLYQQRAVVETRSLRLDLPMERLFPTEQDAVYCLDAALWCPICHADGYLLGVMLIGSDPNLDPYDAHDVIELRRLVDAAALAFTNSAAYQRQCEAEETIRRLYTSLQQAQDDTAAAIARELHDEIINISVRLNIQSLRHLLAMVQEPEARGELVMLLESEQGIGQALRIVCERLHPSGTSDPLGLPSVLRQHLERVDATWNGACVLRVEGDTLPIAVPQQREALHIVREAVANAIKHGIATMITVTLHYPATSDDHVVITISDNGTSGQRVMPKDGHWGLRNMVESARVARGKVTFRPQETGGTLVMFAFPAA